MTTNKSIAAVLVFTLLSGGPGAVLAKRIYQYRDANGMLHFTDRKPDQAGVEVKETKVDVDPQKLVEMLVNEAGVEHVVTLINRSAGPTTVSLSFSDQKNIVAMPPLPFDVVLGAYENREVARIAGDQPGQPAGFSLAYRALPGAPSRLERSDFPYRFPFANPDETVLGQGFNGSFSHTDAQSRYAVDLGVDEGTPVRAARGGVVMLVEQDFEGSGLNREKYADRANSVRILHDDGSMGVYAHLEFESVMVSAGNRVNAGQVLGRAGNTGFSTGPHLHFAIQINNGTDLVSIPFAFQDGMPTIADGAVRAETETN